MWLRSDSRPRLSTRAGFMRLQRLFAQPGFAFLSDERASLPQRSREKPHKRWRFEIPISGDAQFPCHPPVHELHSIEE